MPRELTIKATIPLPDDAFDAAPLIVAARPAIEGLRDALKGIKGATVSSTFDGRSAARGAAAKPASGRKPRVAPPAPDHSSSANGEGSLV